MFINKGLVLEGGGMRGLYTCGVLDRLLEEDFEFRPGLPATLELTEQDTVKMIDVSQDSQSRTGLPMEVTDADLEYDM